MPTITIHGINVHFREAGAGESVVLLHSSASSGAQWRALCERLAPRYRVAAPDLFGYGRTGQWPGGHRDLIADEVDIANAMIERAGAPVHLVGHSYGGHVAARTALARPEQVLSLTLIEPAMHYLLALGGERRAYAELLAIANSVDGALRIGEAEWAAELFLNYWVGTGALGAMPVERRAGVVAAMQKLEYEWPFSLRRVQSSITELRSLAMPTLLVHGARSPNAMQRLMALLRKALPNARSVLIEGAGHMAPVTHADPVNAAIEAHLALHGAARHVPASRLASARA